MAKRGRPTKEITKDYVLGVRLDPVQRAKLDDACRKAGVSESEMIRRAINVIHIAFEDAPTTRRKK